MRKRVLGELALLLRFIPRRKLTFDVEYLKNLKSDFKTNSCYEQQDRKGGKDAKVFLS